MTYGEAKVYIEKVSQTGSVLGLENIQNLMQELGDVQEKLKQNIFKSPYFSSVIQLKDGTLVALSGGQNPDASGHYNGVAYLVESGDMGLTWKKRSTIAKDENLLIAIESRSSSPITIVRDENFESNIKGCYPLGEGAGYAGGIISSAVDGIKGAEALYKRI